MKGLGRYKRYRQVLQLLQIIWLVFKYKMGYCGILKISSMMHIEIMHKLYG
jgi:hypothetical protein